VMIGEMRDVETAEIAVQAAMTGHLVFSTLHTNDALGAIPRLLDLGVPEYLVAATLDAVLAQRLVRKVCRSCLTPYEATPEQVASLTDRPVGRVTLHKGVGCPDCRGTGFRGRVGVFELLLVTDDMKDAIAHKCSRAELRELAIAGGMVPLRSDGWHKVQAGLTTVEEVFRVVQE
jgi:type II secretory ATPase GspE/PulE/Tfp pilus assembly ATPase PilB-like protein